MNQKAKLAAWPAIAIVAAMSIAVGAIYTYPSGVSVATATTNMIVAQGNPNKQAQCGLAKSCSADNPSGLILSLTLNTTSVKSNGSFLFKVTEFNPTPGYINLTASHSWYVSGLTLPCNGGYAPYGVKILRGHYTLQNVSSGTNTLHFAVGLCPYLGNSTTYSFPPGEAFVPPLVVVQGFDQIYAINGYILKSSTSPTATVVNSIESSQPAEYTFVAGDEWGDLVLLNFIVVASS